MKRADVFASEFGAGPDVSPTENRRAMLAAVKRAEDLGGGVVHLPAGEYAAPASEEVLRGLGDVELRGAGRLQTRLL